MDRRRAPRIATRISACLTVLNPPEQEYAVVVEDISNGGARVFTEVQLAVNTPVKLLVGDNLFLGEVCHRQTAAGGFRIGLRLESTLAGVSAIQSLMKALIDESPCARSDGAHAAQTDDNRDYQHNGQPSQK